MRLAFIFCLFPLLSWAQPIQRQFWTTNTNPREVIAQGTNVFITFSTPSPDVRQYLIDVPTSFGQTNNTILSAGTNVVIVTNVSGGVTVYTVSSVPGVQTNVTLLAAGTNVFVSSATNNGVITYTIDVPTNAFPAQQTNWPWQSITNIVSVQLPYSSITNPPSDIERTNWAITDITNSLNLTNWALLSTNIIPAAQTNIAIIGVTNSQNLTNWALISTNTFTNIIVSAGSNAYVTPALSGQVRTYTVDVPTMGGSSAPSNSGPTLYTVRQTATFFDDFTGVIFANSAVPQGPASLSWSSSGSATITVQNGETNAPGIQRLTTQTTAGSESALQSYRGTGTYPIWFNGARWTNEWRFRLVSTNNVGGTDNYLFRIGFSDKTAGFAETRGAFLLYSTNNAGFALLTEQSSTITTNASSFIPQTNTWYKARIEVTMVPSLTNAVLYIDDVSIATNTLNIPTTAALAASIAKKDGSNTSSVDLDFVFLGYGLSISR